MVHHRQPPRSRADRRDRPPPQAPSPAIFRPYLGGERTPHNDATLRASFTNIGHQTTRADLTQAILEGVAFSLRDCTDALAASGTTITQATVIGGGARSQIWLQILASALNLELHRLENADHTVAQGAARLARLALTREDPATICTKPHRAETIPPNPPLPPPTPKP